MRTCSSCVIEKSLEAFVKRKSSKDGRSNTCKDCHNRRSIAWRDANPEKTSEINRKTNIRRAPYRALKRDFCESCGFIAKDSCQLHVDHINGDHKDDEIGNLQTLCANCHALKTKKNKDCGRPRSSKYRQPSRLI